MVMLEQSLELPEVGLLLPSCLDTGLVGPLHKVEGDPVSVVAATTINDPMREGIYGLLGEVGLHGWWRPVRVMLS